MVVRVHETVCMNLYSETPCHFVYIVEELFSILVLRKDGNTRVPSIQDVIESPGVLNS